MNNDNFDFDDWLNTTLSTLDDEQDLTEDKQLQAFVDPVMKRLTPNPWLRITLMLISAVLAAIFCWLLLPDSWRLFSGSQVADPNLLLQQLESLSKHEAIGLILMTIFCGYFWYSESKTE